jgi:hypothetical protein
MYLKSSAVKISLFNKVNAYHIHVNYENRKLVFSRKSSKPPKVDDEYVVYFEGRYRILRATKIIKDRHLKVIAQVE